MMKVIINADDFGLSERVNRAVAESFSKGWITGATIMVNMPHAAEAAALAREYGFFDKVGLHFTVSEGVPLSGRFAGNSMFVDGTGAFKYKFWERTKYQFVLPPNIQKALREEAEAQIQRYLELGFSLRHCDSHHHTHNYYSIYSCMEEALVRNGFHSVRLAKNLNHRVQRVRADKRLYKALFNRRLRTRFPRGTDYFLSFSEFLKVRGKLPGDAAIEMLCHPDYQEGKLINRGDTDFEMLFPDALAGAKLVAYNEL